MRTPHTWGELNVYIPHVVTAAPGTNVGAFVAAGFIHQSLVAKQGCKNAVLSCARLDGAHEILIQFTATAAVADKTVIANVGALPLLGDSYYAVDRFTSGTDVLADRERLLIKPNGDILLAGAALAKTYTYVGSIIIVV